MFRNYLKTTLRSLWKNKRFVVINVLGMGIALSCCIVAYFNWDYAMSYDEEQVNIEEIYRINFVREFQGNSYKYGITPEPVSDLLIENISQIDEAARFILGRGNFKIGEDVFRSRVVYADSTFFNIFTIEMLYGDASVLRFKSSILISDELANRYFGRTDVTGETLQYIQGNQIKDYTIAAIFKKPPPNSSIETDAFTLYDNFFDTNTPDENAYRNYNTTMVLVRDPSRIPGIEQQLQDYIAGQNRAREDFMITRFYLDPFEGMSIRSEAEDISGHEFKNNLPRAALTAPWIMAILILLIACFNFTNTTIAMANRRLKEIGIRKVMGGIKKQLVLQFMLENIFLCILALITGLIISEFLVPAYSNMWPFLQLEYSLLDNLDFLIFLVGLIIFVGIAAAAYPSFYVSSFHPTSILKGTYSIGGNNLFTRVLLTLQFSISVMSLVMGFAFYGNAVFQNELDYGYDKDGVIYAYIGSDQDTEKYFNAIRTNPTITTIASTKDHIFTGYYNDPVKFEDLEREVDIMDVSREYFDAMGMDILEGRNFIEDSESDRRESVLINESFAKEFGWDESVGKRIVWMDSLQFFVIGVVQDFYTNGLWDNIDPMMIRYANDTTHSTIIVKASNDDIIAVNSFMEDQWSEVFPNTIYNGNYINEILVEASIVNDNIVTMFIYLGLVALILTAIGLFSLISLSILKKMKEIGVRKVLGASVNQIMRIINKEYLIILMIAALLGAAGGFFMSGTLMGQIWAYYQSATAFTVIISIVVILVVSAATVGVKVYKAASANPVNALRSE